MLNNYQVSQIRIAIVSLRKQVTVDDNDARSQNYRNLSGIPHFHNYDFSWTANAPEVKELLGSSLSNFLVKHHWILSQLGLRILSLRHSILNRWKGFRQRTIQIIVPQQDRTVEEALSNSHLETHQSLLNKLIKLI